MQIVCGKPPMKTMSSRSSSRNSATKATVSARPRVASSSSLKGQRSAKRSKQKSTKSSRRSASQKSPRSSRKTIPSTLRGVVQKLKGKHVEIVLAGSEFFTIRGTITAVGLDYILVEQEDNLSYVYPEDIAILNVKKVVNNEARDGRKRTEIS